MDFKSNQFKKFKKKQFYRKPIQIPYKKPPHPRPPRHKNARPQKARCLHEIQHRKTTEKEAEHLHLATIPAAPGPAAPADQIMGVCAGCRGGGRPDARAADGVCAGGSATDS